MEAYFEDRDPQMVSHRNKGQVFKWEEKKAYDRTLEKQQIQISMGRELDSGKAKVDTEEGRKAFRKDPQQRQAILRSQDI